MPQKTKHVSSIHPLGDAVFGTEIMVSDPCYTVGTWCQIVQKEVLPGNWKGWAIEKDEGQWGDRIAVLLIHHADHRVKAWQSCWENLGEIGVDSGQAGFFDRSRYPEGDIGDFEDPNSFYGGCCEVTLRDPLCGSVPAGFVSSTGYGDGEYSLIGQRNKRGELVAMAIVFIGFDGIMRAMSS